MTKEDLMYILAQPKGYMLVKDLTRELIESGFPIPDLMDLNFHEVHQISFRSAWILEKMVLNDMVRMLDNLESFIGLFPKVADPSVKRSYSKILLRILELSQKKKHASFAEQLRNYNLEPVLNTCFEWLVEPKERVGVKVLCMDCIFYLSKKYTWALEELLSCVDYLAADASPGMQTRLRKMLFRLKE
jgi:hypothetical protein